MTIRNIIFGIYKKKRYVMLAIILGFILVGIVGYILISNQEIPSNLYLKPFETLEIDIDKI